MSEGIELPVLPFSLHLELVIHRLQVAVFSVALVENEIQTAHFLCLVTGSLSERWLDQSSGIGLGDRCLGRNEGGGQVGLVLLERRNELSRSRFEVEGLVQGFGLIAL